MTDKNRDTVLIVDDDDHIRNLLRQTLSGQGYQCREAGTSFQTMEKLSRDKISLVILDIKIPGKSGIQLIPEIKAGYPDTVAIIATATVDIDTAIQCMKLGAYDYITKPFNLDEVILSVGKALEKRRLERENRDYQQHLERQVKSQSMKIRNAFFNAMTALAYALEAKDKYTSGHSQRVAGISGEIAKDLGLPPEGISRIELAGRVHDIGKIGVRESALNKSGMLTAKELRHVKMHPEVGERILMPIVEDTEILRIVRHHHERYDGTGYPDGLIGEQIPLGARILAVADSYDAMTSERSYRGSMTISKACAEIKRSKYSHFDPEVADSFLKIREHIAQMV